MNFPQLELIFAYPYIHLWPFSKIYMGSRFNQAAYF